jgi:serine/threonine-protein kinase RsbT
LSTLRLIALQGREHEIKAIETTATHVQSPERISATSGKLALSTGFDVVACRLVVKRIAQALEFSAVGETMLVTAASELARNTVIYGGGGTLAWEIVRPGRTKVGLRLTFEDDGPGIPDVARAMTNGWTSGHGLGLGLSGSKRLVHEFSIESTVGVGTRITVVRWK